MPGSTTDLTILGQRGKVKQSFSPIDVEKPELLMRYFKALFVNKISFF